MRHTFAVLFVVCLPVWAVAKEGVLAYPLEAQVGKVGKLPPLNGGRWEVLSVEDGKTMLITYVKVQRGRRVEGMHFCTWGVPTRGKRVGDFVTLGHTFKITRLHHFESIGEKLPVLEVQP